MDGLSRGFSDLKAASISCTCSERKSAFTQNVRANGKRIWYLSGYDRRSDSAPFDDRPPTADMLREKQRRPSVSCRVADNARESGNTSLSPTAGSHPV